MEKEMEEKRYTIRVTKRELKNPNVKNAFLGLIDVKYKNAKHKSHFLVSEVEYILMKQHYSWTDVERYAPKKKDRMKGEVGKYKGKRICIRGLRNE